MYEAIKEDIQTITSQESSFIEKFGVILFHLGFHAVFLYRLSRWFYLHHARPIGILLSYINSVLTGAQISPRAVIGKGLVIYHPQGIVIGAGAVIGNYCTFTQGNMVGQLYGGNDRPTIGDYFYAGTGAKILGKITIGKNVRVGANAVVVNSLPDGVTVATSPAKLALRYESLPFTANHGNHSRSQGVILSRLLSLLTTVIYEGEMNGSIDEDTALLGNGLSLDSIEVFRLLGAIEEEFELTIDDSELDVSRFQTVGSLVTFIQEVISR